jgi:hypothetical protein
MHHCHCSRCRKAHGSAFATWLLAARAGFRMLRGKELVASFASSSQVTRRFCRRCGSVVPEADHGDGWVAVPAGPCDGDPGLRPVAHIFAASKAPWYEILDALPRFDAYPPEFEMPALPDRPPPSDPPGRPRGSCLCGAVGFVVEGAAQRATNCHCGRCRKARAAAHASNFFTSYDGLRFTRGRERLVLYKLPEARYFAQAFCRECGGKLPRLDSERNLAVVPMGALDDHPGLAPSAHIFTGSKAPWFEIADDLPRHAEGFPAA